MKKLLQKVWLAALVVAIFALVTAVVVAAVVGAAVAAVVAVAEQKLLNAFACCCNEALQKFATLACLYGLCCLRRSMYMQYELNTRTHMHVNI